MIRMSSELSCNWKKIQTTIKQILPAASSQQSVHSLAERHQSSHAKRRRLDRITRNPSRAYSSSKSNLSKIKRGDNSGVIIEGNLAIPSAMSSLPATDTLPFWDIPSKDIFEAYGGCLKDTKTIKPDIVNVGMREDVEIGKYVGIDCEMVGVGGKRESSILARISIVNFHGLQIYDSFVKPTETVTNWRTNVSGVSAANMPTARSFKEVQQQVADILKDRIVVGHALSNDFSALKLRHPKRDTRDTSTLPALGVHSRGRTPALRQLAKVVLGLDIQRGHHSSIEDARVTMLIFQRYKSEFDADNSRRFPGNGLNAKSNSKKGSRPKSKTKKRKR